MMETPSSHPRIIDTGLADFVDVHRLQKEWVEKVLANPNDERIIFTEHPPVYTCGRATLPEDRPQSSIPLVDVERGGKLTYHGPGQIVVYPILHLGHRKLGIPAYLKAMEDAVISVLAEMGLHGEHRDEHLAGVWVEGRKVCSIGIALTRWVSYHGLALNVDMDMAPFRACKPCGLPGEALSSIKEYGCQVDIDQVRSRLKPALVNTFF